MSPVSVMGVGEESASVSQVLIEYGGWLDRQRGLSAVTIHNYCWNVGQFLAALPDPAQISVSVLDAGTVTAFMVAFCRDRNTNSAKSMARSVRSFLRFAHATGRTSAGLWGAVPSSAGWHQASLPRSVPQAHVERMLATTSRLGFMVTGRRNYAILQLLARLGLRRAEVAGLRLDDIDWRAGELTVVGKGQRIERLPLPAEVGEAIVAWLTQGRPHECGTRSVFTTLRPAGRPLTPAAIGYIVNTACRNAGLDPIGAHRLRHTLATGMLRAGASLPEVGQVLRHRSARSTAIYAKVDEVALRPLARPWPGTAPPFAGADGAADTARDLARAWPGARS